MVLVCHPSHRLAGLEQIPIEALEGVNMVGFDRDLTIRRKIDRVLDAHRVEVEMVMEFDNIETIKRAVEIDAGVALLPQPTVAGSAAQAALAVRPLANGELVRPLGIIRRRGKELGVTARRFVELLTSEAERTGGSPAGKGSAGNGSADNDSAGNRPAAAPAAGDRPAEEELVGS